MMNTCQVSGSREEGQTALDRKLYVVVTNAGTVTH
jgi:hypothetical protein